MSSVLNRQNQQRPQSHCTPQLEETGKATTLGCLFRTWSLLKDPFLCLSKSVLNTLNEQVSFQFSDCEYLNSRSVTENV